MQSLLAGVNAKQLSKASFSELLQQRDNWRDFQHKQDKLLHRTTESQTAVAPTRKSAVNSHRYFASTPSSHQVAVEQGALMARRYSISLRRIHTILGWHSIEYEQFT